MKKYNIENAIALYVDGMSASQVSKLTNVPLVTLYRKLKANSLTRKHTPNRRVYQVNHNYFAKIDTEEKAYWLGFIYADGCVTNYKNQKVLTISLKNNDGYHLEKIKKSMEATYPLKNYTHKGYGGVECDVVRLTITSAKIFDDLNDKGVVPRKSLIITFPSVGNVSEPLIRHFVRGYFDGDGGFSKHGKGFAFKVCGTSDFLKRLAEHIDHPCVKLNRRPKYYKNNYYFTITGRKQVVKIGDWMYNDASVFLERKHARYQTIRAI